MHKFNKYYFINKWYKYYRQTRQQTAIIYRNYNLKNRSKSYPKNKNIVNWEKLILFV